MRARSTKISADEARRIALAAQGFADARPSSRPDARHLRRVLEHVGILQIDSVNVLVRAHYMPLFSRLGPYPSTLLENAAYGPLRHRQLFEYWGRMASLLPVELHPLMRWRMEDAGHSEWWHRRFAKLNRRRPGFRHAVLAEVAARGPISARDLSNGGPRRGPWWGWSDGKIALEGLFFAGQVAVAARRGFERLYDLPERVIPARILATPTPNRDDAQRELLRIAARAMGVATAKDLCGYFRLARETGDARIAELVEQRELIPVEVEGWAQPAFVARGIRSPRNVGARALLTPFDSLIWERERTERIFGFRYRIEIYTPLEKRTHGYYVLPFLLGDRMVARIDLKADRAAKTLAVLAAHAEPGVNVAEVGDALMRELQALASWLGLERIRVTRRGNLSRSLRSCEAA
ncbi:MAG TPA: winged helix-turn-helix domain-containing protein [Candidatus Acidoferrales bacterium]|nr:winged helix-turn-helix domain-containing protein [Candidatus Acidoferrales bacterium]